MTTLDQMRVVIVGGVAGGASAAARVRRLCEQCEVIVLERGPYVSFANCGLPYLVGGEITDVDSLRVHTPASLRAQLNLDVRIRSEVRSIQRERQVITVAELETGREYELSYDALILATGASPVLPLIPGIDRAGHFSLRNIPGSQQFEAWIKDCWSCRAVVIGGGYVGLEMAEQLKRRGLQVTIVEGEEQVMAPLDPEMAAWLHDELRGNGVELYLNDPVIVFEEPRTGENALASVVLLKSGQRIEADVVLLGLGVRPETRLAREAGLKIGTLGGIHTNTHLQTSDPKIWAVGDAIEVRDAVTGAWTLLPLAGPANRQGRVAADNIVGRLSTYDGTWGTTILRLFRLSAGCTGANEKSLRQAGIPFECVHLHHASHADYYPGAETIAIKVLFSPTTGKLLGAQAVGRDGVDKRIDVFATALKGGLTVNEVAELELAYAPPFGAVKDPVNMAGMAAQDVLAGDARVLQWNDLKRLDREKVFLLDVRRADERANGFIPGSIHIPLNELRFRIFELPRDRDIILMSQSGQRSYFASRILAHHGFRVRNLTGGYRTWKTAAGSVPMHSS
ncbi:MAG: FAD-dependent oxidoreductase [Acidobacteriaceae bacterium]